MLRTHLENNIDQYHLLRDKDTLLLGLSGGGDSVCLFHLLVELKKTRFYKLVAVHLNHGLRREADEEEKFVISLCARNHVQLICRTVDIAKLARQQKANLEETARQERYRLFHEIKEQTGASAIVLAHHRNDQNETVLHHLIRGAALKGLGGMDFLRGDIVRPLLDVSKEEILDYLENHGHEWKEDASNADTVYTRNLLRHEVFPLLRTINPQIDAHLYQTSRLLHYDEMALQALATDWMHKVVSFDGKLGCKLSYMDWSAAPVSFRLRLAQHVYRKMKGQALEKKYGFLLLKALEKGQEIVFPGGIFARVTQNQVVFGSKDREVRPYVCRLPIPGEIHLPMGLSVRATKQIVSAERPDSSEEGWSFYADARFIGDEVMIRNRNTHDAYHPYGLLGKKDVKKIFSEWGLGPHASLHLPVFCLTGGEILYALHGRVNQAFALHGESQEMVLFNISSYVESE